MTSRQCIKLLLVLKKRLGYTCTLNMLWFFFSVCLFSPTNTFAQRPELIIPATHVARSVLVSPNDKWVISAGADGIKIWENVNKKLLKNLKPGSNNNLRFNEGKIAMAIDKNSEDIAMQIEDTVYIFNLKSFLFTHKAKVEAEATAMVFTNDYLFTAGFYDKAKENFVIEKINRSTFLPQPLQKINIVTYATHEATSLSLNATGSQLLLYDAIIGSWIIDAVTGKIIKQFKYTAGLYPFAYQPNGNLLAFTGKQDKGLIVAELDANTYSPLRKSKMIFKDDGVENAPEYVLTYPSANGKYLLLYQNKISIFDGRSLTFVARPDLPLLKDFVFDIKASISLSANAQYYVRGSKMMQVNTTSQTEMARYGQTPLDAYVQFVYKNKDAVCLKDRTLSFENGVFNLRLVDVNFQSDYSNSLCRITADGQTGFLYNESTGLYRYNPTLTNIEYEPINKINNMGKKFVGMQIFDNLNLIVLAGNEGIFVMDLKTLKLLYIVDIPYGLHYSFYERLNKYCDFSQDKSKMILFAEAKEGENNFIYCVDLKDKNEKWNYQSVNIKNLRFTDNDAKLLFTANDKLIYLDAETGKQLGEAVQLPKPATTTIISPSGRYAATQIPINANTSAGYNVGLVNVLNNKYEGTISGTGDDVYGFVYLRNEKYMLTEEYGGLCLWDVAKKVKIGKLYMFEKSGEWVLLTDDGRFDASEGALKIMYFTKSAEIFPLESLYEKFYVPNLLKQIWDNTLPTNAPSIKDLKSPPLIKILLDASQRNLVVEDDINTINVDKAEAIIKIEADGLTDLVSEIRLYQNGKLVAGTRNLTVEDDTKGEKLVNKSFVVNLNIGANSFKAIAINSQRTESLPAQIIVYYKPTVTVPKVVATDIQLHLLVVGINSYKNPKYNLNYASADATAFIAAITDGAQNLFGKVSTIYLKDTEATREGMEAAFEKIKTIARPQDLFLFYYAGHGVINDKKEFFLVPYDVTQLYGNDGALAQKGYSANALQQMSKDIKAQKQLFILDACQSAGALQAAASARGAAEEKAIAQLARSTGTQWLTASGSEQFASEFEQLGHGSFTYCLLQAFKGDAGNIDKKLTVKQLDAYLQTKVPEVTKKFKGTEQYPSSYSYGNDFPIIIIK